MADVVVDLVFQGVTAAVVLSFDDFNLFSWVLFSLAIFCGYGIFSKICDPVIWRENSNNSILNYIFPLKFGAIPAVKLLQDNELTFVHHLYTTVNRAIITPIYIYHLVTYLSTNPTIHYSIYQSLLHFPTFLIQFFSFFLVSDFIYYFFHRALHLPSIYGFIHKHHHFQVSPFRGTYDGINTHSLGTFVPLIFCL